VHAERAGAKCVTARIKRHRFIGTAPGPLLTDEKAKREYRDTRC
jgi:hypothetical protein